MLISYKWLQSYFDEKLPVPEALAERLTLGFAEVDGIEQKDGDAILDIKILPDRACYALSHRGVAGEVAALLGLEIKESDTRVPRASRKIRTVSVRVEDSNLCRRHIARVIENVSVGPSSDWLKERLESVGQRSINNIVDATNFVTLDMGQPLHAFDADKVKGKVVVRPGRTGEVLVTLDGKSISIDPSIMVIADEDGPLDIAGIKGGKKAELDQYTKTILLSVANFDPISIRRTSAKIGIKTDASKRFENNLTTERAKDGMDEIIALIVKLCPDAKIGKEIDIYPKKQKKRRIAVPIKFVQGALGMNISEKEMRSALSRLALTAKKRGTALMVAPPPERLDIVRPEDIVEEIGRIVGLERIPETMLPPISALPTVNKRLNLENKIRDMLVSDGFSEVMTSSFASSGYIAIEKPLASDKAYCRKDLWTNFHPVLLKNYSNAPLLGSKEIKQFEIGKVFTVKGEHTALIIGLMPVKKSVSEVVQKIEKMLGMPLCGKFCGGNNMYECNLDVVMKIHPLESPSFIKEGAGGGFIKTFKPFSSYPFIVRDVALFVPEKMDAERVQKIIEGETRGKDVVSIRLFDSFEKKLTDGSQKTSLAFRLVFQSMKKTLTDAEANAAMEAVYRVLRSRRCEIR
ncbi:MAG: Phenylalanine-tRNA ligase beta subunit [Parcubacteria group bacterium Gr01-1014_17]|nr:MAG: Phenylalanine-tRNA ligase beta subunit [Parcubacteria group bacterium Gr01-1014_17]